MATSFRRLWCIVGAFVLAFAGPAAAWATGPAIPALVVKYRGTDVAAGGGDLPAARLSAVARALGSGFAVVGSERDGAVRLALNPPLPVDQAREALNRLRLDADVLYASFAPPPPDPAARARAKAAGRTPAPTARLVIKFRDPGTTATARAGLPPDSALMDRMSALAGTPLAFLRPMHDGAQVVTMLQRLPIEAVEAIAATIAAAPDVEFAQPDYLDNIALVPNDTCYTTAGAGCAGGNQWDLFDPVGGVNIPSAWDITTGLSNINVAVIDTGALFNHPDLSGRFVGGYDFIVNSAPVASNDGNDRDADASDAGDWETLGQCSASSTASNSSWHGSHVAGTIAAAANNGTGIAGINWVGRVVPARVLGSCGGWSTDIADALAWSSGGTIAGVPANANPARVLNLSIGGFRNNQTCDAVYQSAINTALSNNTVVAIAAGNDNVDASFSSPGNCPGVITVASTIRNGGRASYSNFGTLVEIAAPGGGGGNYILSTISGGATVATTFIYALYQGTSMATPHVAGIASLMLSVRPTLTPAQVLSKIQTTARAFPTGTGSDCTTSTCGAGIIDAAAAVLSAAGSPSTTGLGTAPNPSGVGATVTLTATVAATSVGPTATVRFLDGYATIAGCGSVTLAGSGTTRTATCTTTALAAGTHAIAAEYVGDATNGASRSAVVTQTVSGTKASTTTTVGSSANPANAGVNVTFTATVTGVVPTGTVAFTDSGTTLTGCGNVALAGGGNSPTASCSSSTLAAGTHSITATYSGDAGNNGSASTALSQVINAVKVNTATALSSNSNPALAGTSVTFTATVSGSLPTGGVTFTDGGTPICTSVALAGGGNTPAATCTTAALAQGTHAIVATYGGDAGNNGSASSTLSEVINAATVATTTAVSSNANPAPVGSAVTLTAVVTGSAPTGAVSFTDGGAAIAGCTGLTLSGSGNARSAACTVSTLTTGGHSIVATYGGDSANSGSVSGTFTQTMTIGQTTASVGLGGVAAVFNAGNTVTFNVDVVGSAPTGTVAFTANGTTLPGCGSVAVVASGARRVASCAAALSAGAWNVVATYSGDANNTAASSATLAQTIH